ncbi:hypothetical protein HY857_00650 [Candidatus Saccharibacteria bacterium]|nr:hypothetical protein [Candidatus Saccharibacteria bacterium]
MNKIKSFILATLMATSLMALPQAVSAAGSASLALSAGGSRTVGRTFSVSVIENSGGTAVNGVQADLGYDSSKLQPLSKSCGGAFEVTAPSGGASLACATISAKTGSQVVGTVNFKVLAAGAGAVSFLPSSQITASDGQGTNVWNGGTAGGSYVFAAPVAAAPVTVAPPAPTPAPVVKAEQKTPAPVVKAAPVKKDSAWPKVFAGLGVLVAILAVLGVIFRKQVMARTKKIRKNFLKSFNKTKKNIALKIKAVPALKK